MHPNKSPGPYGMSPGFYQKFWGIVGEDLIALARNFFITGELKDEIGNTNILLIPKKKKPYEYDGSPAHISLQCEL